MLTKPRLPADDLLADIEDAGFERLAAAGFRRYEVSAFARNGYECRHNRNYWEFGDYLALGAGAHGKVTQADGTILRYRKTRLPRDYLLLSPATRQAKVSGFARVDGGNPFTVESAVVAAGELPFEFMLNALRLVDGVPRALFARRTGLADEAIVAAVAGLRERGLLVDDDSRLACTGTGLRFLNDVLDAFLPP